ncbi:MAG: agmatinase [Calditrichaeota bacterium]|nr:MAG: agmatinase [Calditrichota bacterium]
MSSATDSVHFLGLPESQRRFETARAVVLCLPYEATTTYGQGTREGPEAIVSASTQVELYDEELDLEPCEIGIATRRVPGPFSEEPERAVEEVAAACRDLLQARKFVVGLGGEHTVSVGLVKAYAAAFPGLCVLQLDAHSDLRESYNGSRFNHACVMARIQELCPFVGVGIRSSVQGERERLRDGSRLFYAVEMFDRPGWAEEAIASLEEPVYITIDLDFFDPSLVPSVGTPEPGGFQWHETLRFLHKVVREKRVVGFDVVELSPRKGFPASDFVAAKLVYKLLGYVFEKELRFGENRKEA